MHRSPLSSSTSYELSPIFIFKRNFLYFTELREIANHEMDTLHNVALLILLVECGQEKQVISLQPLTIAIVSKLF